MRTRLPWVPFAYPGQPVVPRRSCWSRLSHCLAILAIILSVVGSCTATPVVDSARATDKGVYDADYDNSASDASIRTPLLRDLTHLGAKWVRVSLNWGRLQPDPASYDETELRRLDGLVNDLRSAGIKVLLGVNCLPSWAQDNSYPGNPSTSSVIRADAYDDFGRLGEFLASHFGDRVRDIEVWNEPNLWTCIYPQRTARRPVLRCAHLPAHAQGLSRGRPSRRPAASAWSRARLRPSA